MRLAKFVFLIAFAGFIYYEAHGGMDGRILGTAWSVPALGVRVMTFISGITGSLTGQAPIETEETATDGTIVLMMPAGTDAQGVKTFKRIVVPPELTKFMTPSLLKTDPAGAQTLSPAAQLALWEIITQARANPAAFKEQVTALAKPPRGSK